ncbi:MAG: transcription factor [Candidatus Bathyarchaeia archaeon]
MVDESLLYRVVSRFGEDAVKIMKELMAKGKATEDELARATGVKLNDIRRILFKLSNFSLTFTESIQDEKTGWIIFYWKPQPERLDTVVKTQKRRILDKLNARLEYEKSHDFYYCKSNDCQRLTFEEAMESIFRCPKCGRNLEHFDNTKILETLTKTINMLKEEIESE